MARLAVFVSGIGSIFETMLAEGLPVHLVLADRPCRGLEVASAAGIPTALVAREDFSASFDRQTYTTRVAIVLVKHEIDLVAMDGFMTVLAPPIFKRYRNRILNTHASLLPAFPGPHPVRDALKRGVQITGCTVHIATEDLDAGSILAQEAVPVLPEDTEETLHERIKRVERRLYPAAIRRFLEELNGHG